MRTLKHIFCCLLFAGWCLINNAQENQSYFLHTIEKGQSLYSIASMYGVSQQDIIRLNPGSDKKIYIGRTLRIPRTATNTQEETFHTIEAGETLYRLTVKYNVSAKAICDANPGLSAENFRIGQVIRIPSVTENGASSSTQTQNNAAAKVQAPVQPRCREMHKVKRRETIFSISRKYDITEAELIAANPELKNSKKIKRGSFLCIPYKEAVVQEKQVSKPQETPTNSELFAKNKKSRERMKTIKAAIVLPFLPGGAQNESAKMVEYYEGFLLAVDSLKRMGTSLDLYTYNLGTGTASLNAILGKSEMKDMDIIFGPLHLQHIKPLADFAQKHNIRLVIPFTKDNDAVFRNSAVYQINTPQSYLYSEVYDHFVRQFPSANVVFIESAHGSREKADFVKGLKEELSNRSIPVKTLKDTATVWSLRTVVDDTRENVFIPTSGSNVTLIKILPQMTLLVREMPDPIQNLKRSAERLELFKRALETQMHAHWQLKAQAVWHLRSSLICPTAKLAAERDRLERTEAQLPLLMWQNLSRCEEQRQSIMDLITELSPEAILKKGYSYVTASDGTFVKSTRDVKEGDVLDIHWHDGQAQVAVQKR